MNTLDSCIRKMPKETPRRLISLAAIRIDAERALEKAKSDLRRFDDILSKCLDECGKAKAEAVASVKLIREEERRVKDAEDKVRKATLLREELRPAWKTYQGIVKAGGTYIGPIPKDPNTVVIPNAPEPIPESLLAENKKLQDEYIEIVCKMATADADHEKAINDVRKAEASVHTAVENLIAQRNLYLRKKKEEEETTREAEELKEAVRQKAIEENLADIEEAKKNLAALGAPVPN